MKKEIIYLKGDATEPQANGVKIIAHICNDLGKWGAGFVLAVSRRWRAPEQAYRAWHRFRVDNNFALGAIQLIKVTEYIYIANMIGQRGIETGYGSGVPIRYEAVEQCLGQLVEEAKILNASVHMPRIGCGLAGGKWERIEPLIMSTLIDNGIAVYVYDYE